MSTPFFVLSILLFASVLIYFLAQRLATIKRFVRDCLDSYDRLSTAIDKRNDSVLNFVGAAKFANLAVESKASELLNLRAAMIGAAHQAQEIHTAHEMTVTIEYLHEDIRLIAQKATDAYQERLDSMIRLNEQVATDLNEYRSRHLALETLLSKPFSRIAVSLRPQPIPPSR